MAVVGSAGRLAVAPLLLVALFSVSCSEDDETAARSTGATSEQSTPASTEGETTSVVSPSTDTTGTESSVLEATGCAPGDPLTWPGQTQPLIMANPGGGESVGEVEGLQVVLDSFGLPSPEDARVLPREASCFVKISTSSGLIELDVSPLTDGNYWVYGVGYRAAGMEEPQDSQEGGRSYMARDGVISVGYPANLCADPAVCRAELAARYGVLEGAATTMAATNEPAELYLGDWGTSTYGLILVSTWEGSTLLDVFGLLANPGISGAG